jgi:hypothetical protein
MIAFTSTVLSLLADFLGREPIIYLFGLVCLVPVCKAISIISR